MDYVIRPLTIADEPILWEMVWLRLPIGEHEDNEEQTPELAFAVKSGHRRHGIGAALLTQLVKANPQHSAISISAPANNPTVRLYERFGFKIVHESPAAVTMRRNL
jgi:GNAT superfamily N-acetyltransferase